jgi:hypothetical protein
MSRSCCVLDLDSTLVNTFGTEQNHHFIKGETRKDPTDRFFDLSFDGIYMWGAVRPHCRVFLESCFEVFDVVGIWSAGLEPYVHEIAYEVFTNQGFTPDFVWSKEDCVQTYHEEFENLVRQKPLSKIYTNLGDIDPKRTLLFDDNMSVCSQDPLNHVTVPAWCGELESLHVPDTYLLEASKWIKQKVSKARDYTSLSHKELLGPNVIWTPCQLK